MLSYSQISKNTATIAQERRTQEYRIISSGAPDKIFVLAFDYRGFGYSKGTPSEQGCITDAISVIRWAMEEANIAQSRIYLHSQSLGTAVATATAQYFANLEPRVEFAGMSLCAGFTDAAAAFQGFGFNIGVAPLAPLRFFPPLQRWFAKQMIDTWRTSERLRDLVKGSNHLRLLIFHAKPDGIMPVQHSEDLFRDIMKDLEPIREEMDNRVRCIDLGEAGYIEEWSSGDRVITKEILKHGGHDVLMLWSSVSVAIATAFELDQKVKSLSSVELVDGAA